jgi:hypothetical protein
VTHVGHGIDAVGTLQVDIEVNGEVPLMQPEAAVYIEPFEGTYVVSGACLYIENKSDFCSIILTWPFTLREDYKLKLFENRVLRKIFGPKREELTGEFIHSLICYKFCQSIQGRYRICHDTNIMRIK